MDLSTSDLIAIFGVSSRGTTAAQRAQTSSQVFVRGSHELSFFRPGAKGTTYTAKQALEIFGLERLFETVEYGSAILTTDMREPYKTLRNRRESLGLPASVVARTAGITEQAEQEAENPLVHTPIATLELVARALGLDADKLSIEVGAGGDNILSFRLKSWREAEKDLPARSIAAFAEAAWVIQTQEKLRRWLYPEHTRPQVIQTDDDYRYPVYVAADILAQKTRQALSYSPDQQISSLRKLCHDLAVPLIRLELANWIAGATIETNGVRGILVNTAGANRNVWVQRATVAHELGHLLWDPPKRLNSLLVDRYQQFNRWGHEENDPVEARANAFAVELLAPKEALRNHFRELSVSGETLRQAMELYGLSLSAMSWHLYNATGQQERYPSREVNSEPSDEWRGREQYTEDFFPISSTPQSRRGSFCAYVVKAQQAGWLTSRTAASYLMTDEATYENNVEEIVSLFPEI